MLPKARQGNWGSVITLGKTPYDKVYYFDDERWRTLRRRGTGWHETSTCTDGDKTTLKVEHDTTVYVDYSLSTYDGIVMW